VEGAAAPGDTPATILVSSLNQKAGDILIQFQGNITVDGIVRDQVSGTLGLPGKITIASCCGDIVTGTKSRIETIGVDPGGNNINILTCCERGYGGEGGDIVIDGIVGAYHKKGVTPTINVVAFVGSVTIDGRNDFGLESGIRRTSGLLVLDTTTTAAGSINVQALIDVTVLGNWIFTAGQVQYGAVAVKTNQTNGGVGNPGGAIRAAALTGKITASDRAFDFEGRYAGPNKIDLGAANNVDLSVTVNKDAGALTNAKPVVNGRGGSGGKGDTNNLRSYSGQLTLGANVQVLANAPGGTPGANNFTTCGGVVKDPSAVVDPAATIASTCSPSAPSPLAGLPPDCDGFGVVFPDDVKG
jgi:hypothetical protein